MLETRIDVDIDFSLRDIRALARELAVKPLLKCGALVEGEAKRLLSIGGGMDHIPSDAPHPPHAQKGILRGSITHALTNDGDVIVGPTRTAWYGRVHEFGSRYHPMRPFMRPALMNAKNKFAEEFRHINLAATKAGRRMNSRGKK